MKKKQTKVKPSDGLDKSSQIATIVNTIVQGDPYLRTKISDSNRQALDSYVNLAKLVFDLIGEFHVSRRKS